MGIVIEEIPTERAGEFWEIQYRYLTEDERAYFQSPEYRDVLDGYARREPDRLHRVYFVRDGARIGAAQYCTYLSEDGKCFVLDFWVFPRVCF